MVGVQEVAWPPLPAHWWALYPYRQVGGWGEEEEGGEEEEVEGRGGGGKRRKKRKKEKSVRFANLIPRFLYVE